MKKSRFERELEKLRAGTKDFERTAKAEIDKQPNLAAALDKVREKQNEFSRFMYERPGLMESSGICISEINAWANPPMLAADAFLRTETEALRLKFERDKVVLSPRRICLIAYYNSAAGGTKTAPELLLELKERLLHGHDDETIRASYSQVAKKEKRVTRNLSADIEAIKNFLSPPALTRARGEIPAPK